MHEKERNWRMGTPMKILVFCFLVLVELSTSDSYSEVNWVGNLKKCPTKIKLCAEPTNLSLDECKANCAVQQRCRMVRHDPTKNQCSECENRDPEMFRTPCKKPTEFNFYVKPSVPVIWKKYDDGCRKEAEYERSRGRSLAGCKKRCAVDYRCKFVRYDEPAPNPFSMMTSFSGVTTSSYDQENVCILSKGVRSGKRYPCGSTVVYEKGFPAKVKWTKHLSLCLYENAQLCLKPVKLSLGKCKANCIVDQRCDAIRYLPKSSGCSQCRYTDHNTVQWESCSEYRKFDFYLKPFPRVAWRKLHEGCRKEIVYKQTNEREFEGCKELCGIVDRCLFVRHEPRYSGRCSLIEDLESPNLNGKCRSKYFYEKVLPSPSVKWMKYLGVCKKSTSYKFIVKQTSEQCLDNCARNSMCSMVKYSAQKKKCWLSKTAELKPSKGCKGKYDYHIKVSTQFPSFDWIERVKLCSRTKHAPYYATANTLLLDDCKLICGRDNYCSMFLFDTFYQKCYLTASKQMLELSKPRMSKNSNETHCSHNAQVYYIKERPAPYVAWIKHLDICAKAELLDTVHAITLKQCKENCAREPNCALVKYNNENRCFLHKTNKLRSGNCEKNHDFYEKNACVPNLCDRTSLCLNNGTEADCVKNCPVGFSKHGKVCKVVPMQNLKWFEYRGLCRAAKFYTSHQLSNVGHCKEMCAREKKCAMVKYSEKARKCHLATSNKMKYLSKCHEKEDYYVKDSCVPNPCNRTLLCMNQETGADCVKNCSVGFFKQGKKCEDIDECANPKTCGHHAKCENLVGHHKCVCKKGYKRHGKVCVNASHKKSQRHKKRTKKKTKHSNAFSTHCGLSQIVTAVLLVIGSTLY